MASETIRQQLARLATASRANRKVLPTYKLRGRPPMANPGPDWPLDVKDSPDAKAAHRAMTDPAWCKSQGFADQQMRAVRDGAHPGLLEFERRFVRRMAAIGVPMFAHCVVRTLEMQQKLFADGFSKNDGSKRYPHRGFAVDVIHGTKAWGLNEAQWRLIGHVGVEVAASVGVDLTWGGDWKEDGFGEVIDWDPAHWEVTGWKSLYNEYKYRPVPKGGNWRQALPDRD